MASNRPPLRLWFVKLTFHIIGRYPCTTCKQYFTSSQWKEWGGEPTIDELWSGPMCKSCFWKHHETIMGKSL